MDADLSGACDGAEMLWQYDPYGNLLEDGVHTYSYDAALRLASVSDGVSTTTYEYNGDGDRVSQAVDGVTTTYLLDIATPLTMVLAEQTGAAPAIYYLHGLDLTAQSVGVTTEYFAYDGLGSVRQVVDETGSPLLAQTFDPYGSLYARTGEGVTNFGFTGEYGDTNGLLYLRARYYAPSQGRFFQLDPSRSEMNPYEYSYNNPLNYTDPNGEIACAAGSHCDDSEIDRDDRDLTNWLVREMQANALSDEVTEIRALNSIGNETNPAVYIKDILITEMVYRDLTGKSMLADGVRCGNLGVTMTIRFGPTMYKAEAYTRWMDLVRTNARWDFKWRIYEELTTNIRLCDSLDCRWYTHEVPANIHYGYVGRAAGFTRLELEGGAGVAQLRDHPGSGKWYTYFDEPEDNAAVRVGFSAWQFCKPETLNVDCFGRALAIYRNELKQGARPSAPYYSEYGTHYPLGHFDGGEQ